MVRYKVGILGWFGNAIGVGDVDVRLGEEEAWKLKRRKGKGREGSDRYQGGRRGRVLLMREKGTGLVWPRLLDAFASLPCAAYILAGSSPMRCLGLSWRVKLGKSCLSCLP